MKTRSKAVYGPHDIFLHAFHFHESDHRLRKGPSSKDLDQVAIIAHPSMVLSVLKCLYCIQNGKAPRGHDLKGLFCLLDEPTRKRIEDLWNEDLRRRERQREINCIRELPEGERLQSDLSSVLDLCKNAFEELRYIYETKRSYFVLSTLPDILLKVILEKHPQWNSFPPAEHMVRVP